MIVQDLQGTEEKLRKLQDKVKGFDTHVRWCASQTQWQLSEMMLEKVAESH